MNKRILTERHGNLAVVKNTMEQHCSFRYLCIRYPLLCSKSPWNIVALNYGYCESGIWAQHNWLSQSLSGGLICTLHWQENPLTSSLCGCQETLVPHLMGLSTELLHKAVRLFPKWRIQERRERVSTQRDAIAVISWF